MPAEYAQLIDAPPPGSTEELCRFEALQAQLPVQFREIITDPKRPRTVVVVPSLTLDEQVLEAIPGAPYYEERLLALLLLLRLPHTRVIYLTSVPVHETIIDYYLHLLSGVPANHARKRLTLLSCHDNSREPLSQKLLRRPRLLERIRAQIENPASTHMRCFTATHLERSLAVRLGIPLYACDPSLAHLGDKSHGREIMRDAGIAIPDGVEHLRSADDMAEALAELKARDPELGRAVVKLNEGFSGEGNAIFPYEGCPDGPARLNWIRDQLPKRLACEAEQTTWERYSAQFDQMGGVTECFIEGENKCSPTARNRITPTGAVEVVSTQDQILGGPSGHVYLACRFPSDDGYRIDVQDMGIRVSEALRDRGVIGQVGLDFLCVRDGSRWNTYGIEVNIRMGGATHPYLMLQHMTDGNYDVATATYRTTAGEPRCYIASDNVEQERYRGLTPDDLIDIAVENEIHFHGAAQEGVVFHLMGALSRHGKLGMVCIDRTLEGAERRYEQTTSILDRAVTAS